MSAPPFPLPPPSPLERIAGIAGAALKEKERQIEELRKQLSQKEEQLRQKQVPWCFYVFPCIPMYWRLCPKFRPPLLRREMKGLGSRRTSERRLSFR